MKQDNEFNQATDLEGHWAHVLAAEGSLLTAEGNIPASNQFLKGKPWYLTPTLTERQVTQFERAMGWVTA